MKKLFRSPVFFGCLAGLALVLSYAFGGGKGLLGMASGLVGTTVNLAALWMVIRLLGGVIGDDPPPRLGATLTVFVFMLKLPILIGLGFAMNQVGKPAPQAFLLGLALVYSALVGWTQARA